MFGIPAHPNPSAKQKDQRSKDVNAMVGELLARRNLRASEALAGRLPAPKALPRGALRLSEAQLALYREYFADGRGGIAFGAFQTCFGRFANGELRNLLPADQAKGVCEHNGEFFFLFAEFAFLCIASRIKEPRWTNTLRSFVKAQEIFMHVYRPSPVSPPPCPPARAMRKAGHAHASRCQVAATATSVRPAAHQRWAPGSPGRSASRRWRPGTRRPAWPRCSGQRRPTCCARNACPHPS
ncbi:hypothetical protein LP416_04155 [Polaromonas sp. P2-4]|nr:hypothetical protein LP416_04155 [Polaromonas sp. P2-4]